MSTQISWVKIDIRDQLKATYVTSIIDNAVVREFIVETRRRFRIKRFRNPYEDESKGGLPLNLLRSIQSTIMVFRESMDLDPVFDNVLLKAITCNKVVDQDFITTFLRIRNFSPEFGDPHYWIEVSPYSTWDEIRNIFTGFKSNIKEARTNPKWKNREYLPTLVRKMPSDKNILERDRKFYLEYLKGKSTYQISKDAIERGVNDIYEYETVVKKALIRYKKFIGDITR